MVKVTHDDIQLCSDCTIAAVNGDFTGLDNNPETAEARYAAIVAGLNKLAELGQLVCADGEDEFSRRPCECCGEAGDGYRHAFNILGEE